MNLFDGMVHVSYYQFYVETPGVVSGQDVDRRFAGQVNGLCGAAVPGLLHCITGLHSGEVPLTVELLGSPGASPEEVRRSTDRTWEEIVEVSLTATSPTMVLYDWGHERPVPLPLGEGMFRVRYHATGMQAGHDADVRLQGDPVLDRYLLQFWPADPAPDAVLGATSTIAAYWHDTVRATPASYTPAAPDVNEEVEAFHAMIASVTRSSPARQREEARWLAHRAVELAGQVSDPRIIDWARPALDALDRGRSLPYPFSEPEIVIAALNRDLAQPDRRLTRSQHVETETQAPSAAVLAIRTVLAAGDPDPSNAFMAAQATSQLVHPPASPGLRAELHIRCNRSDER